MPKAGEVSDHLPWTWAKHAVCQHLHNNAGLGVPKCFFVCKKCWDTNPTYPKHTHVSFPPNTFLDNVVLIFLMQTVNIILGAEPISFKKRRKLYWVGSNTCLAQSPVSTGHRSQGRAHHHQAEHKELPHIQLPSQTAVIHRFESVGVMFKPLNRLFPLICLTASRAHALSAVHQVPWQGAPPSICVVKQSISFTLNLPLPPALPESFH